MYKVLDLFSGAGGMSLGFRQTGNFSISVAVEKHPHAKATYKRNHQGTEVLDDILEIKDYDAFERKYGPFDIIIGGPPCQGFSNANRQKNHIISQNNSLVKKYVEVIENLRPKAFVMENVRMLSSETHRFYQSYDDDIINTDISPRKERLYLYSGICPVENIIDFLFNPEVIKELLLPERKLNILRILLKKSYKKEKRFDELIKKGKSALKIIDSIRYKNITQDLENGILKMYKQFELNNLDFYAKYLKEEVSFDEAEPYMSDFIKTQRMLTYAKEIMDNNIIVNCLQKDNIGIYVDVLSFSVIDYIEKMLGRHYQIDKGILNAAEFGAPQLRERFIAIGIKEELATKYNLNLKLPEAEFGPGDFRTVSDAIKDLEEIDPSFNNDDDSINLVDKDYTQTELTNYLRDSEQLFNHVVTDSRETALKRFAALKPGQNFHNLDLKLIENTYSKPERTQNSIYLRLNYNKPCGTVTNVRKSMWIHPKLNRAISIREAARLQTFPDSFVFEGTKDSKYQQVGNAVPPLLAKAIGKRMAELLDACTQYNDNNEDKELKQNLNDNQEVLA